MTSAEEYQTRLLPFRKPVKVKYLVMVGWKDEHRPGAAVSRHEHEESTTYMITVFADTWTDVDQLRRDKLQRLEERIYSGTLFLQDGEEMDIL